MIREEDVKVEALKQCVNELNERIAELVEVYRLEVDGYAAKQRDGTTKIEINVKKVLL